MSDKCINITRFEIAFAHDGDAMICFMGRVDIPEGAEFFLENGTLSFDREPHPSLKLTGISAEDEQRLLKAEHLFVNITNGDNHTMSEIRICTH
jgi:hypothetical protein